MNIEQEMKLWEERSNDKFGQILKNIKELTNDYFVAEEDEYGMISTPIDDYIAAYAVYGNRKRTAHSIHGILYNYDILGNYPEIENMVNELLKLSK